jgi:hypothetical protein
MPLNKLENFIKNAEGRILYVNPNDLDSTDGIENQGNSLTKPFKTIQRALIESARFSYLRGDDNDLVEKTTILVFPGEHLIDNRPGYLIKDVSGNAITVAPGGAETAAQNELTLTLNSNFDLTQEDNILYKFNSINGGIIIPRGTSIVGLDLRKTKVRPKYVPNPTDPSAPNSAIFRITGACYFWQFTFFDGDESGLVYTDPRDFSVNKRSKPTFSHHKLTCFEYADGVNIPGGYQLTDLDMYYSKVANAFNRASGREIDQKYPAQPDSFAKQRPEFEIVGAFAADPITITNIISGDGSTPSPVVTVTTQTEHGLNSGTPIKIQNISEDDYNLSTKVVQVISETEFTYALPFVRPNLKAGPNAGLRPNPGAAVVIETDTVSGASPYIFNCSLRSVYGMNGMHADGSKADGFRSMVVAQFTAVSLQKDDRAFVKYNQSDRTWDGIGITPISGDQLSAGSSSGNQEFVLHLSSDAVYRDGWKTTHIKMSNDAVIQIVSVFAIGFHKHFECLSGGDASITNSNSNFGQFSLAADGFKKDAFDKDDKGYITGIVTPRAIAAGDIEIEWVQFDASKIRNIASYGNSGANDGSRMYLLGYTQSDIAPPIIAQGYRIGARVDDKVYLSDTTNQDVDYGAKILMTDSIPTGTGSSNQVTGSDTSAKVYTNVVLKTANNDSTGKQTVYQTATSHKLRTGESIRIFSETGDLPEGLEEGKVYYAITSEKNASRAAAGESPNIVSLGADQFQIASSKTNANAAIPIFITSYLGSQLRVESRVSDKVAGEIGHPIQYDPDSYTYNLIEGGSKTEVGGWFIYCESNSDLYTYIDTNTTQVKATDSEISYFKRIEDPRSIDEKIYKLRYVVPKELENARDPVSGFILQDSSSVNVRSNSDFNKTTISITADPANNITPGEYDFNRNPRFISTCTYDNGANEVTITADRVHGLNVNDTVIVENVSSSTNTAAQENLGFNGSFKVTRIDNDKTFVYKDTDIFGIVHAPGVANIDTHTRTKTLPRFRRSDSQENLYVYRVEVINQYIKDVQDGVFYLYVLASNNAIPASAKQFGDSKYSQNITDLYPQLDRDNANDNPPAARSFAKRTPLGDVVTNDLKNNITRETVDTFNKAFYHGREIQRITGLTNTGATLNFSKNTTSPEGQEHQLAGITSYTTLTGGSGHTAPDGQYHNVKLVNSNGLAWDGATAVLTLSSGSVAAGSVTILEGGSGYTAGELLYFDREVIGGAYSSGVTIQAADITDATNDYVQITGVGTATGGYYRITNTNDKQAIGIARTAGDPTISVGEYATVIGRTGAISAVSPTSTPAKFPATFEFTLSENVGLVVGHRIRLLDSNNNNKGDFLVSSVNTADKKFSVSSSSDLSGHSSGFVLKHGMSATNASADELGENLGARTLPFYDRETFIVDKTGGITAADTEFKITLPGGSTTKMSQRLELGSYIQIDNEIMRVKDTTFGGSNSDQVKVIRGSMGTIIESHADNSIVKKIKIQPIELRRPSILRASGHTFEYLGYGPGNYSTGLPQVQVKTLTEDEEFLSQSQETACGTVLYTGMDSDGDFYIGNTKYSAQSGEQKTFDVPTPTVTGEDPNRLSVVFDEIVVKERILVEGGKSKQILSQFDGPVTFTGKVRFAETLILNGVPQSLRTQGSIDVRSTQNATSFDDNDASIRTAGGVAIRLDTFMGGKLNIGGPGVIPSQSSQTDATSATDDNAALSVDGGAAIGKRLFVGGDVDFGSNLKVDGTLTVDGESTFNSKLNVNGDIDLRDNDKILLGNDDDLKIFHDGSNSNIYDDGPGGLFLRTDDFYVRGSAGTSTMIRGIEGQGVKLFYNGLIKFETLNGGAIVRGDLEVTEDLQVNQTANFASNTVQITNNRVKADTFEGTADDALRVKVNDGTSGNWYPVMVNNVGSPQTLHRDTRLRFRNGELFVDADIIAFASDDRLKTNRVGLTNALDKVCSLNGFTFNFNETGGELGFSTDITYVGVSAQEVQEVLPEAVKPAPADDKYITVQYEKIVPLLIEAIKELNEKVSALEDKLNN